MRSELRKLLKCCFSGDEELADEAALVAQALIERNLILRPREDRHLVVELSFNKVVSDAIGFSDYYHLTVNRDEIGEFVEHVISELEIGRHTRTSSTILKQAAGIPGIESRVANYIASHWREDELVASRLLSVLWDNNVIRLLRPVLGEMVRHGTDASLKEFATQLRDR